LRTDHSFGVLVSATTAICHVPSAASFRTASVGGLIVVSTTQGPRCIGTEHCVTFQTHRSSCGHLLVPTVMIVTWYQQKKVTKLYDTKSRRLIDFQKGVMRIFLILSFSILYHCHNLSRHFPYLEDIALAILTDNAEMIARMFLFCISQFHLDTGCLPSYFHRCFLPH
jgi:hypothetical protein